MLFIFFIAIILIIAFSSSSGFGGDDCSPKIIEDNSPWDRPNRYPPPYNKSNGRRY